ncbi:alpha/beta hydrolase fold family protein [Botrytis cinerea]
MWLQIAVPGKEADPKSSIMKPGKHDGSFKEEEQDMRDSLLGDEIGDTYQLESQHDEKPRITRSGQGLRNKWIDRLLLGLLVFWVYMFLPYGKDASDEDARLGEGGWSWESIKPNSELIWHQCFDEFDCARLEVPLDWLEPTNSSKAVLAVLRKNATSMVDYKGPLFINPGGPGGSGVGTVQDFWKAVHVTVGANHDIIGFDPRGIGATTPSAHCWNGPQEERIWGIQKLGLVDSHPGMIYDLYAHQSIESKNCEASLGDLSRFVGTASVARDMLEILNKLGYEKLRYWGLSYGTVIGGTFAAMYPDKVERLVSDGNVNYSEWYNGTGIHYIEDTDKVMLAFFDLCHKAGPQKCALYASTPIAIQERLESIYTKLQKSLGITRPKVLTYSDVKNSVIYSLYQPLALFSHFAKALAALEADDGIPFLKLAIAQGHIQPSFTCGCDSPECEEESGWPLKAIGNGDAATYVKCGEGEADADKDSLEVMIKYEEELRRKSPLSASVMFNIRLACAGWKSRTKWNFVGPFEQNTSHPILFIGNSADNITPLASAIHNSHFFPGSSVLVQNSYGHTSASCPSKCTAKHRLAYFQTGILPSNGTVCEPDFIPFGIEVEGMESQSDGDEDEELEWALRELMKLL